MGLRALNRLYAAWLNLPGESLNPAALQKAQLSALNQTLDWARHRSPFYRERLQGIGPSPLPGLDDLARLPFTTASDLGERPQDLLCLSQSRVERVLTLRSSGSSGPAKRVFFSRGELEATAAFFSHGFDDLIGPDASVLALLPHDTPDGAGHLLGQALAVAGRPCRAIWPLDDMPQVARQVSELRPGCLVGLPVHLLALAERLGPGLAGAALYCSEYVPGSLRNRVEAALQAPSYIHYGSSESGLGGAVECRPSGGCHPRADIYWEVVEPGSDRVCQPGEAGELVMTTLTRRAMPLIRYRTGDLASLEQAPCPCGIWGPRLARLGGRLAGPGLAGGGTLRQAELDEALFALPGLMDFQASLRRDQGDLLGIEYLSNQERPDLPGRILEALAKLPAIAGAMAAGGLSLAQPQCVSSLPVSHTIKRIIADQR